MTRSESVRAARGLRALRRVVGVIAVSMLVHCVATPDRPHSSSIASASAPSVAPAAPEPKHISTQEPKPSGEETAPPREAPAKPRLELPRGGREIFPTHRLVGFCGTPGAAPALGRLAGNLAARAKTIEEYANKHANGRTPLPVFELIAVIVLNNPGKDGKWRRRVPDSVVERYLEAAREAKALLLLNIQPGHSDFLTEAKAYEKYLREPDVGLALDPEWAMRGKQVPGKVYGQTTGAVINEVADWLASLVKEGDLPEKALVYHQMNGYVVKDEDVIVPRPGVALIKSVDGLGPQGAKIRTYNYLVKRMPEGVRSGFKLFFDEDTAHGGKLMSPKQVMKLEPEPEYIMYE